MEHSRLSLRTWLLTIYLITQSKTNIAALALRRQLGISWKAAWLLKHKIMEAMRQRKRTAHSVAKFGWMMPTWVVNGLAARLGEVRKNKSGIRRGSRIA